MTNAKYCFPLDTMQWRFSMRGNCKKEKQKTDLNIHELKKISIKKDIVYQINSSWIPFYGCQSTHNSQQGAMKRKIAALVSQLDI